MPVRMSDTVTMEYVHLKKLYREKIARILAIRHNLSKKLMKDALPTLTTMQDEIDED